MKRHPHVASLITGLFFIFIAILFTGRALGASLNTSLIAIGGPIVLIAIGALGLVLSRRE